MDNRKFEQLIDMIINENEEQARELFHEIVVEKSREIYESIMDEEMMGEDDMEEGMGGQVGDLLDEINAEESGMMEDEDTADIEFDDSAEEDGEDLTKDLEDEHDEEDHHADVGGDEELEDRVVKIEDKLDELMAEFEEIMSGSDMGDEEEMSDSEEDEAMMEAVQLQKVAVTHGDNGVQTKSTVAANSGAKGMDSKPVKFSGHDESVPTGPKNPSNAYTKGETSVKGAGSFKNAPGQQSQDLGSTPKPVTKDGATGTHSPVAK